MRAAILGLVTGWLAGCGRTGVAEFLDDELGDEGSSDAGSDESTTDESGSSESTTEESTTDDSTDTSSDDQTTTESTSETTGDTDESSSETTGDTDESTDTTDTTDVTDTDTTDTGGDVCDPEPGDDACTTCAKQFCCSELEACAVDEDCTCVLDCYTGGGQLGQCFGQCGAFGNQPFEQLADCAAADCSNEC